MKSISIFTVIFIGVSIFFYSCSNASEVQAVFTETEGETLRDVIRSKESSMSWTKEIEEDRLLKDIYSDEEYVSYGQGLSPVAANVVYDNEQAVYPQIPDFSSLDITSLPANIKKEVEEFCSSFSKNVYGGGKEFFDSSYIFNYIFFRNDLIKNWEEKFGSKFPGQGAANPLFSKWIFGKPFISTDVLLLPVRFYRENQHIDFTFHIRLENNKIYQISEGVFGADDGK